MLQSRQGVQGAGVQGVQGTAREAAVDLTETGPGLLFVIDH